MGSKTLSDYLLLIRGLKFLGANLIFAVKMSNLYLLNKPQSTATNQQEPTTTNYKHPLPKPSWVLAFICPLKSPKNSKRQTITETIYSWQNHASARAGGKSQSAAVDSLKQPRIPTPGIKMKTHSYNISVFLKKPKFQNCHCFCLHSASVNGYNTNA